MTRAPTPASHGQRRRDAAPGRPRHRKAPARARPLLHAARGRVRSPLLPYHGASAPAVPRSHASLSHARPREGWDVCTPPHGHPGACLARGRRSVSARQTRGEAERRVGLALNTDVSLTLPGLSCSSASTQTSAAPQKALPLTSLNPPSPSICRTHAASVDLRKQRSAWLVPRLPAPQALALPRRCPLPPTLRPQWASSRRPGAPCASLCPGPWHLLVLLPGTAPLPHHLWLTWPPLHPGVLCVAASGKPPGAPMAPAGPRPPSHSGSVTRLDLVCTTGLGPRRRPTAGVKAGDRDAAGRQTRVPCDYGALLPAA